MHQELDCRHCATRNRIDVEEAARRPGDALCGRCRGRLFLEPGEPYLALDPRAYEHPLDRQALEVLRRVPGVNTFLRFLLKHGVDRTYRLLMKQNCLEVRSDRIPSIHRLVEDVVRTMDLGVMPETYVLQMPLANAWTTGVERYQLTLTSGLLDLLDEREIRAVIAHEVGHMQAGHVLYKTAAMILYQLAAHVLVRATAVAGPLLMGMYLAFRKWERCAELTADRAELLAARDLDLCLRTHLKLASGSSRTIPEMDVDQLLAQAREVEEMSQTSWFDELIISLQQAGQSHPFTVWRSRHVDEFARSADYREILAGRHRRREAAPGPVPPTDIPEEKNPSRVQKLFDDFKKLFD